MYIPNDEDVWPPVNPPLYQWWDVTVRVETKSSDGRIIVGTHAFAHHEKTAEDAEAKVTGHFKVREADQRILSIVTAPSTHKGLRPFTGFVPPREPYVPPPPRVQEVFAAIEGLTEVAYSKPTINRLYITEGAKNDSATP